MTRQHSINPAFFQEIKEDQEELEFMQAKLVYLLENEERFGASFDEFVALLELFRDQLALHFALEEAYGYFEEALGVSPRMHRQSVALRQQHASLYKASQGLCDEAQGKSANHYAILAEKTNQLLKELAAHEHAETEMIQEALCRELGGGD